ncbi:MAG TPA: MEDS domain-containing protein [Chloroflexota bacterium]|jgi:hypothetical protein|nr:MEDS domain-containing protein [Chloroflexota bacterium]
MQPTAPDDAPIPFAGSVLRRSRHVCAFFDDADQEHAVLDPFVRQGFEHGDKAFHIVDPALRDDYVRRLSAAGVDVVSAERRGQFELRTWEEAYLRGGHFDQDAMLALIEEVLQGGKAEGYPLTRLVAHMEWALQDRPGVDDLVEYETRLNYLLPRYRDPVI